MNLNSATRRFVSRSKADRCCRRRFGLLAVLPLPDVDASLREIEYAFDSLKAVGVGLLSNWKDKWIGDSAFTPLLDELNRRKAFVYTHGAAPGCCGGSFVPGVPEITVEYNTDVSRAIVSLLTSGTADRTPNVTYALSHGGGTIPYMISRFEDLVRRRKDEYPGGAAALFRQFYYEIAQGNAPGMLDGLLRIIPVSHVLFGSDYPYRLGTEAVDGLADYKFKEADLRAIEYENAIRLMPRLKMS